MIKRRNRIYRRIAVALTVALLVGQSHAFVLAQEDTVSVDTEISDEEKTDVEAGEDISGADADGEEETGDTDDGDAENVVEGDKDITGEETEPGTGTENGEEEMPEEILEEDVSENVDEIEEVEEPEEALTTAEDEIETYANGDIINVTGSIVMYRIKDESAKKVVATISKANKGTVVELEIPGTVVDDSGITWSVTEIPAYGFNECENLRRVTILNGATSIGKLAFDGCKSLTDLNIASSVTNIGDYAFTQCESLERIELPDSITAIGMAAFQSCRSLKSIKLSNSVSSIEEMTFLSCESLEEIELPDSVTSVGKSAFQYCYKLKDINLENVTEIGAIAFADCYELNNVAFSDQLNSMGKSAFNGCRSLANDIVIPRSLDKISASTFERCIGLTEITIPDSVAIIEENAFKNCKLQTLNIAVSNESSSIPVKDTTVFEGCPSPRQVVFWKADGAAELTGSNLDRVKLTYLGAPDGNVDDEEWYGWAIDRPDVHAYTVTIHVYKDGALWADHGRTFALLANGGSSFITDLTQVTNGTYRIYDITGVSADSLYSRAVDTGMTVTVKDGNTSVKVTVEDKDAEATVPYYTVTFYDGDTAYGDDTPQRPQIVLNGKTAAKPEDPKKADYQFTGWKTTNNGSTPYDFENDDAEQAVPKVTSIYASWKPEDSNPGVRRYTIDATAGAGGTINPIGQIDVNEGTDRTFVVTPSKGYRIQSVTVDDVDMTKSIKEAGNSYTFTDVRANHTIDATFEADGSNTGGNGGDENGDNDNSGGGNSGNNNSGGGIGDGGNSGSGDSNAGNSGSGDGNCGNPGGENGDGSDLGDGNATAGGSFAAGSSSDGNVSGGGTERVQKNVLADNSKSVGNGSGNTTTGSKEPKTGDAAHAEVYATIAMIAGLTYLLLYFMEEGRGMSEREKDALVAAFVRWAKKGGAFRRCCAMVAIFCILAYYHSIGKRVGGNALNGKYLGQLS